MNSKLAVGLAMFLSSLAAQLTNSTGGWIDVSSPRFMGTALLNLAGFILAVWGGVETKPKRDPDTRTRAEDKRQNGNP